MIIHLDILLPAVSSNLPEATREPRLTTPYLVLLRMGFTFALGCHQLKRCALTAPFHPYLMNESSGGLFSVALSRGSPRWKLSSIPLYAARTFLPLPYGKARPSEPLRRASLIRLYDNYERCYSPLSLSLFFKGLKMSQTTNPASKRNKASSTRPNHHMLLAVTIMLDFLVWCHVHLKCIHVHVTRIHIILIFVHHLMISMLGVALMIHIVHSMHP